MPATTPSSERREHKRFLVKEGLISIKSKRGIIVDISKGGLSFYYADKGKWGEDVTEAKILFIDEELCLEGIPLVTISDQLIDDDFSQGTQQLRRRSMEFGDLTDDNLIQLADVISCSTSVQA